MKEKQARDAEILLVDDSPGDVRLTREALGEDGRNKRISVARNGEEAMRFLRREEEHARAPRPDLILLDLRMPGKSGGEVLREIKEDPDLRRIPVVVFSLSHDEKDIMEAYGNHANCYVVKPLDLDQFMRAVRSLEAFWLEVVELPEDGRE